MKPKTSLVLLRIMKCYNIISWRFGLAMWFQAHYSFFMRSSYFALSKVTCDGFGGKHADTGGTVRFALCFWADDSSVLVFLLRCG